MSKRRTRSRLAGAAAAVALVGLAMAFVGTLVLLYFKSRGDEPTVKTDSPLVTDIVKKAVATGSLVPRREVLIKPRVSGILRTLHVKPGDVVEEGALIAEIQIVPDIAALTRAEAQVQSADIALRHAQAELRRAEQMSEDGLLSRRELAELKLTRDLRRAELSGAHTQLQVAREGATSGSDVSANTKVRATVAGTVLDVPVEEGASVIESNTFNEGTTIASVANMSDMIFLGRVDEADVDKVRTGMDVNIRVGAIDDTVFEGTLEYIAPKGQVLEGSIQFEIKAALDPKEGVTIRAGYSANAEIVLERRDQVLAVPESLLQFDGETAYVDVEIAPGKFERHDLQLGISDGIHIEVKGGVDQGATIRHPEPKPKG